MSKLDAAVNTTTSAIPYKKNTNINVLFFSLAAWTFALEFATYLVGNVFFDKLIKIGAFVCMVVFLRYRRNAMTASEKILIILFSLLFLFALIPSLLIGDLIGVSQWFKFVFMWMIFPILILSYHMLQKRVGLLVSLHIGVAVFFSIQAIVAFFAVYWGVLDLSTIVDIDRRPGQPEVSLGILGFGNAILNPVAEIRVLRPQGWFLEPSLLASFLLLPAFVSAGRYWKCGKKFYLFSAVIIFVALMLTLSLAGYLGVVVGVIFFSLSKPVYRRIRKLTFFKYSYPILILGIFYICASFIMHLGHLANQINANELADEQGLLAKVYARDPNGPSGNLLREADKFETYISLIASKPLGIGLAHTLSSDEDESANAFIFWAMSGGIMAVVLIPVFFGYIFFAFCHPLLISEDVIFRCLAASFIGHAIHNLSYGNWMAPYFLIHLALVVMCARQLKDCSSVRI